MDKIQEITDLEKDTLDFVTPHALTIHPDLVGQALARPWRRGLAILIDMACIGLLATVPAIFLVIGVSYLFLRLTSKKNTGIKFFSARLDVGFKRFLRIGVRAFAVLFFVIVSIVAVLLAIEFFQSESGDRFNVADDGSVTIHGVDLGEEISDEKRLELRTFFMVQEGLFAANVCDREECWQDHMRGMEEAMLDIGIAPDKITEIKTVYAAKTGLAEDAQKRLLTQSVEDQRIRPVEDRLEPAKTRPARTESGYSIIAWVQGLFTDLGLSFGWSVLYFTFLTSAWHGQTVGKKLLKIRVVQLDNTPLSLWESFGRYGGYAAGLSTGLLGYLQIYWDSNRQAIQDKISSTVVISLARKPFQEPVAADEEE